MKKLVLVFALFFSTPILLAQTFNQPSQFNTVCDDDNDGTASFYLGEISYEILGNLSPQEYTVTHHETHTDALVGTNALLSPYTNISPFIQTIYARIVTLATNQVTILQYNLNVNQVPIGENLSYSFCDTDSNPLDGTTTVDLTSISNQILQNQPLPAVNYGVFFYLTMVDAQYQSNPIMVTTFMASNQQTLYYSIEDYTSGTGCAGIGSVTFSITSCSLNCPAPTQLFLDSSTSANAIVLDWAPSPGAIFYTIMYSVNGAAMQMLTSQFSSISLPNPQCGSVYSFSVIAHCSSGESSANSQWLTFDTEACAPQSGVPANLTQCSDDATACFNLTTNDALILGNLNPSEYTVTYYVSAQDADNGVAAISAPSNYCTQNSEVYARLENNANPTVFYVFPFFLIVENTSNVVQLNGMDQCDDNTDTIVIFNLTTVQAQINSTNTLEYYSSLDNAQNQTAPITNPSAYSVNVQSQSVSIFIREIVPNGCDSIYVIVLQAYANCNLAYTCTQANPLCNALGAPFANTVNNPSTGTFDCLGSTPNPTWFYLPISTTGNINLEINQNTFAGSALDVDYIVYGPFTNPSTPCNDNTLLLSNVVSCSFSAAAVEYPIIPNAQPGQIYLLMVTNYSNQPGLITINQTNAGHPNSAEIDCSGIRLNAFLDANNNGVKDTGEQNFPLGQFTYEVNNNGNIHNIVSPTGIYNIYDNNTSNSYDFSYVIDPLYAASYGITTASYNNVHAITGGGMQVYNFPITVAQAYNDLAVNIIPVNAPRPGFTYQDIIRYTNNGNQTVSGTVTFTHDALVSITANTQTGTTPITNGLSYNFTNLLPFESREMTVTMQVPTIPTVMIGNLLTNTASIVPLAGDVVPMNNNVSNSQVIIGSYDPNDKMEAHGGRILHSTFTSNDYLTYTIRFENSGTASAIDVRVNDVLDARLDENTVSMIRASHPYIMDRVNRNINWTFENIQLPVSVADTNIGKGYITFKVKPRAGYAIGDIIPNTASIYFDFNPAIVTNTFNTEFVQQLGLEELENADFVFYPNPVTDIVTITVKNNSAITNMAVYDVSGKMIIAQKPATLVSTQTLDLSSVSKGMYLLEVTTESNSKVVKKLIVK